jgi:poly(U)-specific endoribonuclease
LAISSFGHYVPKFRGTPNVPRDGNGDGTSLPTQPHNNAAIRIARALPNPPGLADQGEWVELENVSSFDFDLAEWRLSDEEGRIQRMSGALASGQTRRIDLTRANEQSMMLRNRGGWVLLFQGDVRRAAVRYPEADQGEIFTFD